MKVTVSFGDTKVVVPCGDGNMPVRDLIDKAMHRYRKSASAALAAGVAGPGGLLAGWAAGSPDGPPPAVDYVKLARDNGILDWDDRVCDVLDDRELVIACLAPADPPNSVTNQLDVCSRVPPLHDSDVGGGSGGGAGGAGTDDSLGSASSPEFHTAPASAALSAVTARVRHGAGGESGSGGAPGSLTTLGDTCSPGGSTSGASSAAGPDLQHHHHGVASSSAAKQHHQQQQQHRLQQQQQQQQQQAPQQQQYIGQLKATSTAACNVTSTGPSVGVQSQQHTLGCPAAGGSEPTLGPPAGLARIVCCRKAYAGSSIQVSASGLPPSGSPPASRGPNGSLFGHKHQLHRGSLDSFAVGSHGPVAGGGGGGCGGIGGGVTEQSNEHLASAGNAFHHHNAAVHHGTIAAAAAAIGKARTERVGDSPSPGIPGRSPVMVAVDSNSSSDHDEDYPRLRREPIGQQSLGNHPSGVLRWLDAQDRLQHGEVDPGDHKAATQPLSLRIDARETPGVEPSPGGTLLKTSHSGLSAAALKEAEAFGPTVHSGETTPGGGNVSSSHAAAVYRSTILLTLLNENSELPPPRQKGGGLGIQVKPYYSPSLGLSSRVEAGLEIQRVVPGGRMEREGKLRVGDRIIEINGQSLTSVSFVKAQEMFREAMRSQEIALRVIPAKPVQSSSSVAKPQGPPVLPKPNVGSPPPGAQPTAFVAAAAAANSADAKRPAPMPPPSAASEDEWDEAEHGGGFGNAFHSSSGALPRSQSGHLATNSIQQQQQQQQLTEQQQQLAEQQPSKKAPPPPQRSPLTHLSRRNGSRERTLSKDEDEDHPPRSSRSVDKKRGASGGSGDRLRGGTLSGSKKDLVTNTKRLGVRHVIVLVKGRDGFGFSLTTRDTQTNGPNPILVKSILNRGSAIRDGRLKCGDRMLEVDDMDVTHKSQKEVVQMLKSVAVGENVQLTISRQEEEKDDDEDGARSDDSRLGSGRVNNSSGELNTSNYRVTHMTFDISLEKTDLNGLGISVKGRSRESPGRSEEIIADGKDEGVYVKNVINGGAAANDGRLQVNDQILEINGVSLRGLSNKEALARLRSAVQRGGGSGGSSGGAGAGAGAAGTQTAGSSSVSSAFIRVVVARRQPYVKTAAASSSTTVNSGDSSNHSMTISAEVHQQQQQQQQQQEQQRPSKNRLARQPTRQQRIEDDEADGGGVLELESLPGPVPGLLPNDNELEDDDDLPLPPPPPLDELDGAGGTLGSHSGTSTLEHPDSAISSFRPSSFGHRRNGHIVPLLDLTAAANHRQLPTPPTSAANASGGHRRSVSAELIGQQLSSSEEDSSSSNNGDPIGCAKRRARGRSRRSAFAREGLGRRSMSEKRHAMEAAQNFAFFQELSAQRHRHGSSSSQAEDAAPAASSEQLLQRCQRLLAQRHPSTDSLGRQPVEENALVGAKGLSSSLRGPLKAPCLHREDSASQLSTASTSRVHHPPRSRRCRPISFRRAVDHSLPEPDDAERLESERARPREKKASFWKGLLGRRKDAAIVAEPPPPRGSHPVLASQLDAEARVLAWQRRNDAVLARRLPSASSEVAHEPGASAPGNRAFSVYIPADPADYLPPQRRRNSLTYGDEEEGSTGRLQVAR